MWFERIHPEPEGSIELTGMAYSSQSGLRSSDLNTFSVVGLFLQRQFGPSWTTLHFPFIMDSNCVSTLESSWNEKSTVQDSLALFKNPATAKLFNFADFLLGIEMSVWDQLEPQFQYLDPNRQFWWNHSGRFLQTLLHKAGYTATTQHRHLKFYLDNVIPYLGVCRDAPIQTPWQSFMTDDGFPVEFSWEWGSQCTSPKIRFSIEPIGLQAGVTSDKYNYQASRQFEKTLHHCLDGADFQWLQYFRTYFETGTATDLLVYSDHSSHTFFGFDLLERSIKGKAYFFPRYKADELGRSHLETISLAVRGAPHLDDDMMQAFTIFEQFAAQKVIEPEMVAIDLVDPRKSRIKVYFRLRDTTLSSIVEVATLGVGNNTHESEKGIESLCRFWRMLFSLEGTGDPFLTPSDHRTAGVLYYAEFKYGVSIPSIKIYAPVRHYSRSDDAILRALASYFDKVEHPGYTMDYAEALECSL